MAKWYIVKTNWETADEKYSGLGGDCWPDMHSKGKVLLKKVEGGSVYIEISGATHLVLTDCSIAEEYFLFLKKLNLNPFLLSVADDLETADTNGYDYGHPAGGYSVIESVILTSNDVELKKKYLNEHLLFKNTDAMNDFLDYISLRDDVETMDFYCAVSIKRIS